MINQLVKEAFQDISSAYQVKKARIETDKSKDLANVDELKKSANMTLDNRSKLDRDRINNLPPVAKDIERKQLNTRLSQTKQQNQQRFGNMKINIKDQATAILGKEQEAREKATINQRTRQGNQQQHQKQVTAVQKQTKSK